MAKATHHLRDWDCDHVWVESKFDPESGLHQVARRTNHTIYRCQSWCKLNVFVERR